jgi:hypothetical protein
MRNTHLPHPALAGLKYGGRPVESDGGCDLAAGQLYTQKMLDAMGSRPMQWYISRSEPRFTYLESTNTSSLLTALSVGRAAVHTERYLQASLAAGQHGEKCYWDPLGSIRFASSLFSVFEN